jgi:hypothetical protein
LIAFRQGVDTPVLAVAIALVFVVAIDAMDLRRRVGRINQVLKSEFPQSATAQKLRESIGHSPLEVLSGLAAGGVCAALVNYLAP